MKRANPLAGLLFICLTMATSWAASTATLTGRVADVKGDRIAGAHVQVTNVATNASFTVTTNSEGLYVLPGLAPGVYHVTVKKDGFQTAIRQNVVLNTGDNASENFTLLAGSIKESVTVEGRSTLIERDSPAVATVVNRQFVENLPLNGRSFQTLLELTPGVTLVKSSIFSTGQFSVNGHRSNANYFMVDGVSANFGASLTAQAFQQNAGTLPALSVLGGFNNLASVDALEEFRVQTSSYGVEFGRNPGAQVSITTRSGGNQYTWSLFNYFRNEALDAADFFDKMGGLPKRKLRQNDFGGVLGGPVRLPGKWFGPLGYDGRDKTFFFFSYEGLRLAQPQAGIFRARVPSLAVRQTAPEPFKSILNSFPLPNAPRVAADGDPADTERYVVGLSYPTELDAVSVRIDQRFSSSFSVFGRYADSPSEQRFRSFPSQENQFKKRTRFLTAGATWAISPRVVSDTRFNYSADRGEFDFASVAVDGVILPPDSLLFPSFAPRETTAVSILTAGFGPNGVTAANLTQGKTLGAKQRQINVVENLTLVASSHELKLGADYRLLRPIQDTRSLSVSYAFATEASRSTGIPTSIQVQAFAPITDFYAHNFSAFVQDTWRLSKRLTLTYGLRYEVNPPPSGDRLPYQIEGLDSPLTATLAEPGTPLWETKWDNFAPRIGFGLALSEKNDLVLRGGFGIYYDTGQGTALRGYSSFPYNVFKTISSPAQLRFPANDADLQPPFLDQAPPPYSSSFFVFDHDLELPYTRQWSLTLEKGLGRDQVVSAGYVGAQGRRLLRNEQLQNFNAAYAGARFGLDQAVVVINPEIFGPDLNSAAAFSGSTVSVTRNASESDYHALQAQFRRRLSRGLQALASYTYAKSLDDVSDETVTGLPFSPQIFALERGPSDFDIRHTLVAAITYDIPLLKTIEPLKAVFGDWSVDAIGRYRSALPFNAIAQVFDPLNVGSTRRLDVKPGIPVYLDDPAAPGGKRLNPDAFAVPAPGVQGNLGRNALRGFGMHQIDLSLRRQFGLTERLRVQFRAEFFNVFNTPSFAEPAGAFGSVTFGIAQSMLGRSLSGNTGATQTGPSPGFNSLYQAGGPRSIQFSLKLLY